MTDLPVYCYETNTVYQTIENAAKAFDGKLTCSQVERACRTNRPTVDNWHFCYYDESKPNTHGYTLIVTHPDAENQLIFHSIIDASKAIGIAPIYLDDILNSRNSDLSYGEWMFEKISGGNVIFDKANRVAAIRTTTKEYIVFDNPKETDCALNLCSGTTKHLLKTKDHDPIHGWVICHEKEIDTVKEEI